MSNSLSAASTSTSKIPLCTGYILVVISIIIGYFGSNYFDAHLSQISINRNNPINTTSTSPSPSSIITPTTIIREQFPYKSIADERQYQWITLSSGIEILLISDLGCTKSAISVDINRGSLSDSIPGLAHLLEHMLFLGTKKYPNENDYSAFLNTHGGGSNAYTDLEHTNYFFHVDSSAFEGALDRFAQFFISPLMNSSSLSREMHAVDSEHQKNLNSDNWRMYQLLKESASPLSSFHSFSTGNFDTLNLTKTRLSLLTFHNLHYIAKNMRICMVAKESLVTLRNWTLTYFQDVRTTSTIMNDIQNDQYMNSILSTTDTVQTLISIITEVNNAHQHSMQSTLPNIIFPTVPGIYRERMLTYKPIETGHTYTIFYPLWSLENPLLQYIPGINFINSLISDESHGSLLSLLRSQGLVENIFSGIEVDIHGFTLMSITIELSPLAITKISTETNDETTSRNLEEHIITIDTNRILDEDNSKDYRKAKALFHLLSTITDVTNEYLNIIDNKLTKSTLYGYNTLKQRGMINTIDEIGLLPNELDQPINRLETSVPPLSTLSYQPPIVLKRLNQIIPWPVDTKNNDDDAYNIWNEYMTLADIEFQYPKHADEESTASSMSRLMHTSNPELILNSPKLKIWQPTHALRIVRAMIPSRSFSLLSSSLLPIGNVINHNITEPIYGTTYGSLPYTYIKNIVQDNTVSLTNTFTISNDIILTSLSFPPRNPYIPTELTTANHEQYANIIHLPPTPASRTIDINNNLTAEDIWLMSRTDPLVIPVQTAINNLYTNVVNELIGNNDDLRTKVMESYSSPTILSWWTPIPYFNWPKTFISIELLSLTARSSPITSLLSNLYTSIASEMINEDLYQVLKAESSISLASSSFGPGLTIHIQGYSDSIHRILQDTIINKLLNPTLVSERIIAHLTLIVDDIRNRIFDQPYQRASYYYSRLTRSIRYSDEIMLQAAFTLANYNISELTNNDYYTEPFTVLDSDSLTNYLQQHIYILFSNIETIQTFISGNEELSNIETIIVSLMSKIVPLIIQGHQKIIENSNNNVNDNNNVNMLNGYNQIATIPLGSYVYQTKGSNPDDPNSAVIVYYQFGYSNQCLIHNSIIQPAWNGPNTNENNPSPTDINSNIASWSCQKRKAAFSVLGSLIREPAFDTLRTQQQLGYIVSAGSKINIVSNIPDNQIAWQYTTKNIHTTCSNMGNNCRQVPQITVQNTNTGKSTYELTNISIPIIGDSMLTLVVLVQGPSQPAHILDERATTFMHKQLQSFLDEFTETEFLSIIKALRSELKERPTSPSDIHFSLWNEITIRNYNFRKDIVDDQELAALQIQDIRDLYQYIIHEQSRRVAIEIFGNDVSLHIPSDDAHANVIDITT